MKPSRNFSEDGRSARVHERSTSAAVTDAGRHQNSAGLRGWFDALRDVQPRRRAEEVSRCIACSKLAVVTVFYFCRGCATTITPAKKVAAEAHFGQNEVSADSLIGDIIDVIFGHPVPLYFHVIAEVSPICIAAVPSGLINRCLCIQNKTKAGGYLS